MSRDHAARREMTEPRLWQHRELVAEGLQALASGGQESAPMVDGRVQSVKATPVTGTASKMALGLAVLPPGYATPPHSHEAEEVATILAGTGHLVIAGEHYSVDPGTVMLTPSGAEHMTVAGPGAPLVVWWVYAPPGDEARWLGPAGLHRGRRPDAGGIGQGGGG